MMTRNTLVFAAFLALSACRSETPTPVSAASAEVSPTPRTMPRLGDRCAAVTQEIWTEVPAVRALLRMQNDRLVQPYQTVVDQLSPTARASLRRHNVHVVQYARYLW